MSLLQLLRLTPYGKINNHYEKQFVEKLIESLESQNYKVVRQLLNNSSSIIRYSLLRGIAKSKNGLRLAQRWVKVQEASPEAHLLLGVCYVLEGWDIRGGDYISNTSKDKLKKFHEFLEKAEQHFLQVMKLDSTNADAYGGMIQIHYNKGFVLEDIYPLFEQGITRDADNFSCFNGYFLATTEKWCGSHDDMFSFVSWGVSQAPQGSYTHILMAQAYNELALSELGIVKYRLSKLKKNMRNVDFAADVVTALCYWLEANLNNIEQKIADKTDDAGGKFYALNHFATALYWTGALDEAKIIIKALQGEIMEDPWCFYPSLNRDNLQPAFIYDRICKDLKLKP